MNNLKVFIVDGDCRCRNVYKQKLRNMGFSKIYTFTNGEECLSNMFIQPDVIVLNYDMVTCDGLQILKIIKIAFPEIMILMISERGEEQIALEAMAYGASAYISKNGKELDVLDSLAGAIASGQDSNKIPIPEGLLLYKNFNESNKYLFN